MMTVWIELTFALAGAAAIGFWTAWRLRSADLERAEAETERIRAMWMQMADDDGATPEPTLHSVGEEAEPPPGRRATG